MRNTILLFFLLFSFCLNAQSKALYSTSQKTEFNLPPGYHLHSKTKIIDLSFKLNKSAPVDNYTAKDLKFLKNIPENEIDNYKTQLPDYYQYYIEGLSYINSLSHKVRTIYSKEELWYIYAFDLKLKKQLATIR